ncbi:MAG: imidazole glycerol phosphate synthase subunit HisH [Sphaerochaetaceae bacterium]|nr:imidazole glycerol phosphate synthase subunit HisH [Sphaerochaetaceae bacterium]
MDIAVVKYNAGNIRSVLCALDRIGYKGYVTSDPEALKNAERVIFPGVGEASSAMAFLKVSDLDQILVNLKQPFLGICLGMQLMCSHSEESNTKCLGIFDVPVVRFPNNLTVPHMGWNTLLDLGDKNKKAPWCYFVHSYYVPLCDYTAHKTNYEGIEFSSALKKDNFMGYQFHPEKSSSFGEDLLASFIKEGTI